MNLGTVRGLFPAESAPVPGIPAAERQREFAAVSRLIWPGLFMTLLLRLRICLKLLRFTRICSST
jgi:hypothetical protein